MPIFTTLGAACAKAWGFTSGLITDQYFNLVSLLLPGNGTNGANNNEFLDSGTANSGSGFTITRNGNTTQGTFSPFSQTGWASYSAGGSGNYWAVGGGMPSGQGTAFTLECWIYVTDLSTYRTITRGDSAGQLDLTLDNTGLVNIANTNTANICQSQAGAVQANRWHHIMVTRTTGNVYRIYVDGVGGTASSAYNTSITANPRIGYNGYTQSYNFVGYISNFRVTNTLVQSNNFTPPTTPLTAISGTQLLVFQSNRFVDNSGNANSITPSGSVAITPFSPFAPTQSYSAAAVGGSGYFDGTGDYLTVPASTAFSFGTSPFTIETWVYLDTVNNNGSIALNGSYGLGANSDWILRVGTSGAATGKWEFTTFFGGTAYQAISNSAVVAKTWTHIAAVRNGNTFTLYIDGVAQTTTATNTNSVGFSNQTTLIVGDNTSGVLLKGWFSNFRIVNGTAVYTGNFTPPTGQLTTSGAASAAAYPSTTNVNTSFASSACSLLLNFTNGGVIDATAKNDLETVGNAQISTTQSKWGGGSIYLPQVSTTDYLKEPSTIIFSGDFVIEGWIYFSSSSTGFPSLFSSTTASQLQLQFNSTGATYYFSFNGSTIINAQASGLSTDTWTHFAIVRSGTAANNISVYFGGTRKNQATSTATVTQALLIGVDHAAANPFKGYVDDFRITLGNTRGYSGASITVPTAPFPVQ